MRRQNIFIIIAVIGFLAAIASGSYVVHNYRTTNAAGLSIWTVGDSLNVVSGGAIKVENGGAFIIDGGKVATGVGTIDSLSALGDTLTNSSYDANTVVIVTPMDSSGVTWFYKARAGTVEVHFSSYVGKYSYLIRE